MCLCPTEPMSENACVCLSMCVCILSLLHGTGRIKPVNNFYFIMARETEPRRKQEVAAFDDDEGTSAS